MFLKLLSRKLKVPAKKRFVDERILKDEFFSIEQFKQYAKILAVQHTVSYKKKQEKLLARLKENEDIIVEINDLYPI